MKMSLKCSLNANTETKKKKKRDTRKSMTFRKAPPQRASPPNVRTAKVSTCVNGRQGALTLSGEPHFFRVFFLLLLLFGASAVELGALGALSLPLGPIATRPIPVHACDKKKRSQHTDLGGK